MLAITIQIVMELCLIERSKADETMVMGSLSINKILNGYLGTPSFGYLNGFAMHMLD